MSIEIGSQTAKRIIHVNELTLEGDSNWIIAFNRLSDLWREGNDETLDEEIRKKALERWMCEKTLLEMGMY